MNDYRTLQLHISQQTTQVPPDDQGQEGYKVMKECAGAAQRLLASHYNLPSMQNPAGNEEAQKAQLRL
jgi:hypothetical protein